MNQYIKFAFYKKKWDLVFFIIYFSLKSPCFILTIFFKRKENLESYAFYEKILFLINMKNRLAATSKQKITKRDIWRVNVANCSNDVIDIVNKNPIALRRGAPFSLYLSSQLMFGLAYVTGKQYEMLLEDVKTLVIRLGTFKETQSTCTIDLEKTIDASKVTMCPPDMINVPLEFGRLLPTPEPVDHHCDFFFVPSPRSSAENYSASVSGSEMLHTVSRADITMQELPEDSEEPIPQEMLLEEPVDFLTDLPFLEPTPVEQVGRSDDLIEPQQQPLPITDDQSLSFLLTPEAVTTEPLQLRIETAPDIDVNLQQIGLAETRKRALPEDSQETFVLAPITVPGQRRRKRRHLIVDSETALSFQQIQTNLAHVDNYTVPNYQRRVSLLETPESMFKRLSSSIVAKGIQSRIKRLQTLQEPSDLFPYAISPPEKIPETEMPREEEEEAAPFIEQYSALSPELRRDATESTIDPSVSGLLKTSSLLKVPLGFSSTISLLHRDAIGSPLPPMIENEEYMLQSPETHIPEPITRDFEMPAEEPLDRVSASICQVSPVSPERTPPPSSVHSISSVLGETMQLILLTLEISAASDEITFNALLRNTYITKKRVAELFNHLLHLHARIMIDVRQPVPGGEIFIKILDRTSFF
ncbi:rad21_Rec8_N domain-containing protein [Caerostris darwini]|uniref:Rad21_Rec8_N domain-containing protein n=1 Tax=Caerostris darwini TaxID=1538125 RepID=A0AAV4SYN6_9ARAC|nr:rad21_Rec8_N domain-containing protein [Caerostris darwini]